MMARMWVQRLWTLQFCTFPLFSLDNHSQPWSLGGDKGPERWPHPSQILLTLFGRQT